MFRRLQYSLTTCGSSSSRIGKQLVGSLRGAQQRRRPTQLIRSAKSHLVNLLTDVSSRGRPTEARRKSENPHTRLFRLLLFGFDPLLASWRNQFMQVEKQLSIRSSIQKARRVKYLRFTYVKKQVLELYYSTHADQEIEKKKKIKHSGGANQQHCCCC